MTVTTPSYIQGVASGIMFPVNITNIVATLRGATNPSRLYVVSGHYDSRNTNDNNFTDNTPSADGDVSSVAVSMELARVMATHRPAATIMFIAVGTILNLGLDVCSNISFPMLFTKISLIFRHSLVSVQ